MGLGSDLKKARESRKISLETVSQKTRIPVKYLEALEAEDYGVFPSQTHARGFARAYAKVVGLDPSALTAQFKAEVKPVEVKIKPPNAEAEIPSGFSIPFLKKSDPAARRERLRDEDFDPESPRPEEAQTVRRLEPEPSPAAGLRRPFSWPPWAGGVLLLVLLALAFEWGKPRMGLLEKALRGPVKTAASATPFPTAVPARSAASVPTAVPTPPASAPPAGPPAPLAGVPDKYQHLILKGLQQSWVLVTMDDGASSSEIDLAPGETKSYKALRNFKLRIGNAGGVDASYDGKPLGILGVSGQVVELSLPGGSPVTPKS